MRLVLFGGLIFIGGSILFSASYITTEVSRAVPAGLGVLCMAVGIIAGIAGLIMKDRKQ